MAEEMEAKRGDWRRIQPLRGVGLCSNLSIDDTTHRSGMLGRSVTFGLRLCSAVALKLRLCDEFDGRSFGWWLGSEVTWVVDIQKPGEMMEVYC